LVIRPCSFLSRQEKEKYFFRCKRVLDKIHQVRPISQCSAIYVIMCNISSITVTQISVHWIIKLILRCSCTKEMYTWLLNCYLNILDQMLPQIIVYQNKPSERLLDNKFRQYLPMIVFLKRQLFLHDLNYMSYSSEANTNSLLLKFRLFIKLL